MQHLSIKYIGAIFGFLGVIIAVFGLVNIAAELLLPLLFPVTLLMRGMNFPGMLFIGLVVNMLFFAVIGYYFSQLFKNKWVVPKVFGGIIVGSILTIIIEALVWSLCA